VPRAVTGGRKSSWKTVQVPREVFDQVDEFAHRSGSGYTSVAEFVRDAVRRRLDELGHHLDDLKPDAARAAAKLRSGSVTGASGFCHKCGKPLVAGDTFCANCGTKTR